MRRHIISNIKNWNRELCQKWYFMRNIENWSNLHQIYPTFIAIRHDYIYIYIIFFFFFFKEMPNPRWYPNYCGWSRANPPVSSELSSSESITSSSKLSSSATFTTCSCPTEDGGCTDCVYTLFRNKKERKRDEINSMLRRKKLSKKRNPFEMSSKTLKKLESKKSTLQNSHCKSKYIII